MIDIELGTIKSKIRGVNIYRKKHAAAMQLLNRYTSYPVEGAERTLAFQNHHWDGTIKLVTVCKNGSYNLWTGVVPIAIQIFENRGVNYKVSDCRTAFKNKTEIDWLGNIEPREYQLAAVKTITATKRALPHRGIIKVPPRGGKTVIAALIIKAFQARTAFIVNQERQFSQTVKLFKRLFGDDAVGEIGGGVWKPSKVNVVMIQTLTAALRKPENFDKLPLAERKIYREKIKPVLKFTKSHDVLFVDEVHHVKDAETWKCAFKYFDAPVRVGLSATVYINHRRKNDRAAIWVQALTGPIVYEIPQSDLIKNGYLMPADIYVVPCSMPRDVIGSTPQQTMDFGISSNTYRNRRVAIIAKSVVLRGRNAVIVVSKIKHLNNVMRELEQAGVGHLAEKIYGRVNKFTREKIIERFRNGETKLLVGTVLREAIDIPEIEVVIVAEGGKSRVASIQRLRNLTKLEDANKGERVEVYDFDDRTCQMLQNHTRARLRAYNDEEAFAIYALDWQRFHKTLKPETARTRINKAQD